MGVAMLVLNQGVFMPMLILNRFEPLEDISMDD
jgi:hypothetical protein